MKQKVYLDGISLYRSSDKAYITVVFDDYIIVENRVFQDPRTKAVVILNKTQEFVKAAQIWLGNNTAGFILEFDLNSKLEKVGKFGPIYEYDGIALNHDSSIPPRILKRK